MPDNSPFITSLLSSATTGAGVGFNFGRTIWACFYQNGADVGARTAFSGSLSSISGSLTAPATAGTYTTRAYDAQTGGNLLAESGPITITAAAQGSETGSFGNLPSSATAGVAVTGITYTASNVATPYYTTQLGGGAESGRVALSGGAVPSFTPGSAGTLTLRMYDAATGGNLVTYASFTVAAAQQQAPAETGTLSGVPISGSATVPLTGGAFALQNGTSAYVGLFNVTTGAYQGALVAVSGASGSLPSFTPSVADTFAYKLTSDSAGADVLFTSPNITVGAAPDVVLTGLPASIAAGQPLSGTTFTLNNGVYGGFVLWDQTAQAEDGPRFTDTVTPDSTLDVLVPQNAGHPYTIRLMSVDGNNTLIWESATFNVTAGPGALPAAVGTPTSSNVTTTSLTETWPAVSGATSYLILASLGPGSKFGSVANTTVSSPSYTFTGLSAGGEVRFYVSAINASGRGPATLAIGYTAAS